MKRILFVDDDQNVLDGLQNLLRKQRRHWHMAFALGGEAALAELERAPFDVVVSDMRMPGIDGATLLRRVKEKYPATARIILSGHADREAVVRALPVSHQFLGKPCDGDHLRSVIERTCELHKLLGDDSIRSAIGKLDKLPSAPAAYFELMEVVARPTAKVGDIAAVVERDPAMSIKVLQLVNSSYFGLARPLTSIQQAVLYLGLELLRGLVLTAHVFSAMGGRAVDGFSLDQLQQDGVLAARIARALPSDQRRADEAFTAALVRDIGKMIVALGMPDRFSEISRGMRESGRPFHSIERELGQVTHAEIGAYLLGVWGLPFPIVEAVAFHHNPGVILEGSCEVLAAVHVADALVESGGRPLGEDAVDREFLERTGLAAKLARWEDLGRRELEACARAA